MTHAHWCKIEVGLKLQMNIHTAIEINFVSKVKKLKFHTVAIAAKDQEIMLYKNTLSYFRRNYSLHKLVEVEVVKVPPPPPPPWIAFDFLKTPLSVHVPTPSVAGKC